MSSGRPGLINDIITRQCYLMESVVVAAYQKYDCLSTDHSDIGMLARQPTNHSHSHSLPLPQSDSRTALSAHTGNTPHFPPSLLFLPNDVPREDIGMLTVLKYYS